MPEISFKRWVKKSPVMFFGTIFIAVLSIILLTYKLNSLHAGPNNFEVSSLERLSNIPGLLQNPIDFIYLIVAKILSLFLTDLTALRATSIIFALLTLLNLRFIVKYWYDTRIANIGVLLASTSFWFIALSRIGAPLIMPAFWLSALVALYAWSNYAKNKNIVKILMITTASIALYSPSLFWWTIGLISLLIFQYGLKPSIMNLKTPLIILPLLLIAPLIYACVDTNVLKQLLGINSLISNPFEYIENIGNYILQITLKGSLEPALNLGRLPYLDIFQLLMLLIGIKTHFSHINRLKGRLTLVTPLLFIAIISVFSVDQTKLAILTPIIFILMAAGVNEFINLWLKGFPRNPIGRALGLMLVAGLLGTSGYYNVQRYFIAWAQNPDVKAAHQLEK